MQIYHTTVKNYLLNVDRAQELICEHLHLINANLESEIKKIISEYLSELREDLQIIVETEYADPVYRDSYYQLYSKKLKNYSKNCVRFSFFEPTFTNINEFLAKDTATIKRDYLGFLVLRPILRCIGRNAIDVKAKKAPGDKISICKATIKTTCAGHKLLIKAFPHSSQDGEHMSCAENSAWTMLEYFGNKYSVYDPILPSQIIDSLQDSMYERLIPTEGLGYIQLSYILKQTGFETKIYDASNPMFREIFTCYIESGLPLLVGIKGPNFAHAVVCLGREYVDNINFVYKNVDLLTGEKRWLSYWNESVNKFVVNDDNYPIYSIIDFDKPAGRYNIPNSDSCKITHCIVPLHDAIHVTAEIAHSWSHSVLSYLKVDDNRIIRTFLTTSRSYREYILERNEFCSTLKQALLQIEMPKFIWITEILIPKSDAEPMRAEGVIVLDSTGNTRSTYNHLENVIYIMHRKKIYMFDSEHNCLDTVTMSSPDAFTMFRGNLK